MEQNITCINCPMGCRMTVKLSSDGNVLSVSGNTCPRGEKYAVQECTLPVRMITAVIPAAGSPVPLSVKTSRPVPKAMIRQVMDILGNVQITLPVSAGQVIVPDILQTGSDIIATRDLP
jgi:CxxC motif-containing protein